VGRTTGVRAMPEWLEQYSRTLRWYRRLKALEEGPAHEIKESDRDDVYAFFQNCWHLKDWIPPPQAAQSDNILNDHRGQHRGFPTNLLLVSARREVLTRSGPCTSIDELGGPSSAPWHQHCASCLDHAVPGHRGPGGGVIYIAA
jgi:hypothetical protein